MTSAEVMAFLVSRRRVLIIGGAAIILHGLHRGTKDTDIWMDPLPDIESWLSPIAELTKEHGISLQCIGDLSGEFRPIDVADVPSMIEADRMIRIVSNDRPIDVFYRATNLGLGDFDGAWERGRQLEEGARVIDAIDLIVTKYQTGRDHDQSDIAFLQSKIEKVYEQRLKTCYPEEANELFERFLLPESAAFAAKHAENDAVRKLGLEVLARLSADGDPFAIELQEQLRQELRSGDDA